MINQKDVVLCDLCSHKIYFSFNFRLTETILVIRICKSCRKHFQPTRDWEKA